MSFDDFKNKTPSSESVYLFEMPYLMLFHNITQGQHLKWHLW